MVRVQTGGHTIPQSSSRLRCKSPKLDTRVRILLVVPFKIKHIMNAKKYYVKNETTGEFTEAGLGYDGLLIPPLHGVAIIKYEGSTSFISLLPNISPAAAMLRVIVEAYSEDLLKKIQEKNKFEVASMPGNSMTPEQKEALENFNKVFPGHLRLVAPSLSEIIHDALMAFSKKYIKEVDLQKTAREFYEIDF